MPIFDQGYQNWSGPLTSHTWRWLAVARHGLRASLKGKIVKILLLAAWAPAIALVVMLALWGLLEQQTESVLAFLKQVLPPDVIAKPQEYRSAVWTIVFSFFFKAELLFTVFLVLVIGPHLISRDLRFNALPLYFSRPIRRFDYFIGKLAVIGFFLAATAIAPAIVAYVFGVAFSLDLGVVRDTHQLLWGGMLYGLVITLSTGTLMLAMSSLSRRSIYVAIAWAGFCFLTLMVSGILIGIRYSTDHHEMVRERMDQWLADHPPPEGVEMRGQMPVFPRGVRRDVDVNLLVPEEQIRHQWRRDWSDAYGRAHVDSSEDSGKRVTASNDWRPIVGYTHNLDRIGDALLNVDAAWVTIGKSVEKPRAAMAPMIAIKAGGHLPHELMQPANERRLAEQMVWQYPWYWSAGVLGGLWLISVLVLSSRIKSLDRLK